MVQNACSRHTKDTEGIQNRRWIAIRRPETVRAVNDLSSWTISRQKIKLCCFLCHLISRASDPSRWNLSLQGTRCASVVGRSLQHYHRLQCDLALSHISLETPGWVRGIPPLFPSSNLTRGHAARWLSRVHLHVTIYLQTTMPSPGLESLLYGT
ncbi:hypothetical protein TNCV_869091 [Trichonephila clavipes]|nr:hypothetical protein TNCV_869091 [Trichonephila clavipes]